MSTVKKIDKFINNFFDESLNRYGGEDTELAIRINEKFPSGMRKIKAESQHITNILIQ